MTNDIHPHWTNTDAEPGADKKDHAGKNLKQNEPHSVKRGVRGSIPKKIKVNKKGAYGPLVAGATGIIAISFVFVQGVSFITANLTQRENAKEDVETATGALTEPAEEIITPDNLPPIPSLADMPRSRTGAPAAAAVPRQSSVPDKIEPVASPPPSPAAIPTINLDRVEPKTSKSSAWPSMLRVNKFAVGSGLIPEFPPTAQIPIHTMRETREQLHAAAADRPTGVSPLVTRQPATGPELWVAVILSLLIFPLFQMWRKGEA